MIFRFTEEAAGRKNANVFRDTLIYEYTRRDIVQLNTRNLELYEFLITAKKI